MSTELVKQTTGIKGLMANDVVVSKFKDILGKNANAFISSVTTIATTTRLSECDPKSILSAAIAAASLNLQVTPTLGFAAMVPYKGQAQFQIMAKGLVQLSLRSGQFKTINVTEIYEGELKSQDRLTGTFDFSGDKKSEKIVGYAAYFELINGFAKSLYMTSEQITAHAKRFSKTFDFGGSSWKTNFEAMARKTVLKLLLSRYAPLSVEMTSAITQDQAVIKTDDNMEITDFLYVDNVEHSDNAASQEPIVIDQDVKATRKTQVKESSPVLNMEG